MSDRFPPAAPPDQPAPAPVDNSMSSAAVMKFKSCRWRRPPEDGPECCGHRDVLPLAGTSFNPAFAGAYDFSKAPDFGGLMDGFLDGLPDGGLVMCHPGFVDETLENLDPFTTQREAEHAYLASDRFPALLAANKVLLS